MNSGADPINYAALMEPVARHLCGEPNHRMSSKAQLRFGTNGSLAVEISGDKAGTFYDHEHEVGGGVLDLVALRIGAKNGEAKAWLADHGFVAQNDSKPGPQRIVAAYDYFDANGVLAFQVLRLHPKTFRQRRPDGTGGWIWNLKGVASVPYRLPELVAADPARVVLVPEGEKDVDRLRSLGFVATCNPAGAGKWKAAHSAALHGRRVVVLPDNDEAGEDHAAEVAASLRGMASAVAVLPLPRLQHKGDVSDWLGADGTADELQRLAAAALAAAAERAPPEADAQGEAETTEAEITAAVDRLSCLSEVIYQTQRKTAAKALGLGVGALDKLVARERKARRDKAARAQDREPGPAAGEQRWPLGFTMTHDGLFAEMDGDAASTWLCASFQVLGEARDLKGEGWSKWLRWSDGDGREHTLPVPDRLLHLMTGELEAMLADRGLRISPDPKLRGLLRKALNGVRSGNRVALVRGAGWKMLPAGASAYVFGDGSVLGAGDERLVLHPKAENAELMTGTAGTLDGWKVEVAALAEGNAPAAFCVCAAFVGPLLDVFGEISGGFHIHGGSKSGKTLAARVGLSVWGMPFEKYGLRSWHATVNALEAAAEESGDGLLVLDEIANAQPAQVTKEIYLLANEAGKGRLKDDTTARARRSWRTFILSTGEHDLASFIARSGQKMPAGAEVRLPSIKTTAADTWPNLHGRESVRALAPGLLDAMRRHHGTASRAFVERLARERADAPDDLLAVLTVMRERFTAKLPPDADAQVFDVARRFALVACAGELAAEWGILPWAEGEPERASNAMFRRWMEGRGGTGASEADRHVEAVRLFLMENGMSRFIVLFRDGPDQSGKWLERLPDRPVAQRAGWRRPTEKDDRHDYLIPADVWRAECAKMEVDPAEAARTLHGKGFLEPGEGNNLAKKVRLPGVGAVRVYVVKADLLGLADDKMPEAEARP